MIKPELVADQTIGEIIAILTANRFKVLGLEMKKLTGEQVAEFYVEHEGKPFYGELIEYITSGPVVAIRLEKENAVKDLRTLVGATNPAEASPGTIRYLFGRSLQNNGVHASDSDPSAERELGIIFGA